MRRGAWAMLIVGSIASSATAVDGVREINQVCAIGPGCFSGDAAGFPVVISARGSYRLTSNLTPPVQTVDVIQITASGVTIDLNGFAIQGTNTYSGPGGSCTAGGSGDGVESGTGTTDVVVSNGHVRGMGSDGILLLGTNSRVERVTAFQNCGHGILVGFASLVTDSLARLNFLNGISANDTTRVSSSVVNSNGGTGIAATGVGRLIVDGCVASSNGVDGINANNSLIRGNLALSNMDDAIEALGDSEVMESIANGSPDRGLSVSVRTAIGLNVATGNTTNLVGGVVIGCNLIGAAASCPP